MAFVPGHKYDVFVSYAHVDNLPLAGAGTAWVSTLIQNLKILLARKLGRDVAEIWMDPRLAGNVPLTPAILDSLGETATLLVILSTGYLASEWCQREKNQFLKLAEKRQHAGSRIFLVELNKVDLQRRPPEFADLLGYRFWEEDVLSKKISILGDPVPRPEEPRYYERLSDLSHDLAAELERLKQSAVGQTAVGGPAVFLAEATDDLETLRDEIKRYLQQAGLRVLPERWYPRDDPASFSQAMSADLQGSKLFIQLLSGLSGRKPVGLSQGYPGLQYEQAVKSGVPVLQWRSRELDLDTVSDEAQRKLLEADTVWACGIEEFKAAVVEEIRREPRPPPSRDPVSAFVFVNSDASDRAFAQDLCDWLTGHGVMVSLPVFKGNPAEIRQDLEENLKGCDGVIIVYGATPVTWVRSQLIQGRKILSQREQPLIALALCEGPPSEKDELALMLPNMSPLNCRTGLNEAALRQFIDRLRG
ncbi:MAG: toll/interleukin-1 receptor domain-containing protein [Pseudomonadota bacterium]|nr:toll/interleukin-1 receptor domain-containing protein [Pseudomonadota bacterium]